MKTPQLENGYTRIANEILEAIAQHNLTAREIRIILIIIRFTYGYNKRKALFSIRSLSRATKIKSIGAISNNLANLINRNIIINHRTYKGKRELEFNKSYQQWIVNNFQKEYSSVLHKENAFSTSQEEHIKENIKTTNNKNIPEYLTSEEIKKTLKGMNYELR